MIPADKSASSSTPGSTVPVHFGPYVWGIAIAAALGGLLFGYDWVVIGGARQFYEQYFQLKSPALVGWANSCALVGCLIGSLCAGPLASHYGRRKVLLASAILFALSSALTGWAYSFQAFIVWRIVGGIAIGLSSNVSPLYIAEISPAALRGRLVSLNQFAIVVGILSAQVVNWLIARPVLPNLSGAAAFASWNIQFGWRWMFTAVIVPALVFMATSFLLPESPRWLMIRGRNAEAKAVLTRVGGAAYADQEIGAILRALHQQSAGTSSLAELFGSGVRRTLLVGIGLAVLQQWTGINVLFNYAGEVYRSAGHGADQIFFDIVITGTINLVFTVVAMGLVDRLGRRPLMTFGCLGIGVFHVLCALAYRAAWPPAIVLAMTLAAIGCYATTLAPVTWVLIAEIFPNRVRSLAISVAVSALWTASFILTYSFPIMNRALGTGGTFLMYGAICLIGSVFCAAFVPDTKGRSLEQIELES